MADHKRCLFETDNVADDDDDDNGDDDESDSERQKRVAVRCSRAVVDSIHRQSATTTTTTSGDDNIATSLPPYKPYTPYRLNASIRSFKHQVKTVVAMKKTLNRSDDKRYILNDRVHTLAHGHYSIE
uniref:Uncharacterized protein n=1 Tax=Sipha flava TaxID=143950 RepID=A0A2S2R2L2_9HEMI